MTMTVFWAFLLIHALEASEQCHIEGEVMAVALMEMHCGCDQVVLCVLKAVHSTEEMQTGIVGVFHFELELEALEVRQCFPQQHFRRERIVFFSCGMKHMRVGLAYALLGDPREKDQMRRI
jgi:hypothetical protein